ncbi:MAG: hypothetical protein JSW28_00985 [Thermoplasmata archaeon]|nr:MAG: hypothetical protein JSW28_00985 [Thermoplasmata archaeon]
MKKYKLWQLILAGVILIAVLTFYAWTEWTQISRTVDMGTARELEVKSITNCAAGERIKIHGTIESTRAVVLSGEDNFIGWEGSIWGFSIADESGVVNVTPRKTMLDDTAFEVFEAPHIIDGKDQFWAGDRVWAVGAIHVKDGEEMLVLEAISGAEDGFSYPYTEYMTSTFTLVFNGVLVAMISLGLYSLHPDIKMEIEDDFWVRESLHRTIMYRRLTIGLIPGSIPGIWAAFIWRDFIYACVTCWALSLFFGTLAFKHKEDVEAGARYTAALVVNNLLGEQAVELLKNEFNKNNIKFEGMVIKEMENSPLKYRFSLPDHEVSVGIILPTDEQRGVISFDIRPVTAFNDHIVLPLVRGIIEDAMFEYTVCEES